jgi:hypothetical protein
MNQYLAGLIGFALGVLVTVVLQTISREIAGIKNENGKLRTELDELKAVKDRSRQTGSTMAGLEDAMSALIDMQYNRQVEDERITATVNMLQKMREGPFAYDKEQPNNRREFK